MSQDWAEDNFLDFKELEDQIIKFVDKSDLEEMLRIQLSELEMLQSMFSNPGEFSIYDYSVIADMNDFLDGKISILPPCLDFNINLTINDGSKLEVCVNLPHDYPANEPDIFVRNDKLTRCQQHDLNADLEAYISTLDRGEICVYSAISWLQENGLTYFSKTNCSKQMKLLPLPSSGDTANVKKLFGRYWIYSHHIYSKIKRREILDLAQEYNITGFCLPGRPGIICGEGWDGDCEDWWQKIRSMNWKKIMCKKKEEVPLINNGNNIEYLRKFKGFNEISFENSRTKARDAHMDMGEFFRYLSQHECGYVFKDYFGVDGKGGGASNH